MRLQQIQKSYLYEGLDRSTSSSMLLWESAGLRLKEAALTADQIQQLFAAVEKSATDSGDNRTMLGKGKDAVSAVNKAWEDLKTKIQDSGPIKGFDQKVSDALSKIGMGAADPQFNGEVNKWVQKYRDFAKKHPIAQGAIYATLIGLAGITGAGVGGAAALGLLKMADKLLQGERFSSAAYSGAKTGVTAFAASKLGDLIKGVKPGEQVPEPNPGSVAWEKRDFENYDYWMHPDNGTVVQVPKGMGNPFDPNTAAGAARDQLRGAVQGGADLSSMRDQAQDIAAKAVKDAAASGTKTQSELVDAAMQALEREGMGTNVGGKLSVQTIERISQQAADAADTATDVSLQAMDQAKELRSALRAPDFAGGAMQAAADAPKGANMNAHYLQRVISGEISRPKISADDAQAALDWQAQNGGQAVDAAATVANNPGSKFSKDYLEKVISGEHPRPMISKDKAAELLKQMDGAAAPADAAEKTLNLRPRFKRPAESFQHSGRLLSEGQVYLVFNRVTAANDRRLNEGLLFEGPMDAIKGAAGKAAGWLKTKGKNLTTKVTADKLNSAWQKAGSPMDSGELAQFLADQGVNDQVIKSVYAQLKLPSTTEPGGKTEPGMEPAAQGIDQVKAMLAKLPTDRKVRLVNYMTKQLKVA